MPSARALLFLLIINMARPIVCKWLFLHVPRSTRTPFTTFNFQNLLDIKSASFLFTPGHTEPKKTIFHLLIST